MQCIAWLNRPLGRVLWSILIGVAFAMLGALENYPVALFIAAVVVVVLNTIIEYLSSLLRKQLKESHLSRVEEVVTYLLQSAALVFNGGRSQENFQIAVMLPNQSKWLPRIRHHLQRGKGGVTFHRAGVWMSYIDNRDNAPAKILPLTPQIRDMLHSEDKDCFEDVLMVLVAPIYKPNSPKTIKDLIGALTVYSDADENHSVLALEEGRCKTDALFISEKIASILCYDCLCL